MERETRNRLHKLGNTAKKVVMVWTCVAKRRQQLGEECMEYDVDGSRLRGRPKRTWREVVEKDCQTHKLNREDAIYSSRWRKLIQDG